MQDEEGGTAVRDRVGLRSRVPVELACIAMLIDYPRNAAVRDEPHQRHKDVDGAGHPWADEGYGDGDDIKCGRELAFEVTPEGRRELGVGALLGEDDALQDTVGNRGQQHHCAVERGRHGRIGDFPQPRARYG